MKLALRAILAALLLSSSAFGAKIPTPSESLFNALYWSVAR